MSIDASEIKSHIAAYDLVRKHESVISGYGAPIGPFGQGQSVASGGCVLGPRPVDQHILGFERLGAKLLRTKDILPPQPKA